MALSFKQLSWGQPPDSLWHGAAPLHNAAGPLGVSFAAVAATGIILSAVYMLWMCQRVLFGPVKEPAGTPDLSAGLKPDLTAREIGVLAPIAVLCLLIGVWPKPVLQAMSPAIDDNILARVLGEPQASSLADGRQEQPATARTVVRVVSPASEEVGHPSNPRASARGY